MTKTLRIISLVFFLSAGVYAGVLNINRATINKSELAVIEGKVVEKKISRSKSLKYRSYHLEFQLANRQTKIGIAFTSKKQAYTDSTYYLIDTGKTYKFYLDKTFPTSDGLNNGIDKIEFNNVEVFNKSHKFELYGGVFFILLSIGLGFVSIKFGKWKDINSH